MFYVGCLQPFKFPSPAAHSTSPETNFYLPRSSAPPTARRDAPSARARALVANNPIWGGWLFFESLGHSGTGDGGPRTSWVYFKSWDSLLRHSSVFPPLFLWNWGRRLKYFYIDAYCLFLVFLFFTVYSATVECLLNHAKR